MRIGCKKLVLDVTVPEMQCQMHVKAQEHSFDGQRVKVIYFYFDIYDLIHWSDTVGVCAGMRWRMKVKDGSE